MNSEVSDFGGFRCYGECVTYLLRKNILYKKLNKNKGINKFYLDYYLALALALFFWMAP